MVTFAILAVVFLSGAVAGVIVLVCASIRHEDSRNSLYATPPNRATAATRRLVGWYGTQTPDTGRSALRSESNNRPHATAAAAR
jgi:hypothetical protein